MRKPTCEMCDKITSKLSARGWCATCEEEFEKVMTAIRCATANGICTSPITCVMHKRCVQLRATLRINGHEPFDRS